MKTAAPEQEGVSGGTGSRVGYAGQRDESPELFSSIFTQPEHRPKRRFPSDWLSPGLGSPPSCFFILPVMIPDLSRSQRRDLPR